MEYLVSERLKRHSKSITWIVLSMILTVVILNYSITLTNYLDSSRNAVSFALVVAFGLIIFVVFKEMICFYEYKLSSKEVIFFRASRKHERQLLSVKYSSIELIDKYENITVNTNIKKTHYYLYDLDRAGSHYFQYEENGNKYRVVFKPSERLLRILERKVDTKKDGK